MSSFFIGGKKCQPILTKGISTETSTCHLSLEYSDYGISSDYMKGEEGMESWKKDARRDVVMVNIEALVPKDHLLRKVEQMMDYDWLHEL